MKNAPTNAIPAGNRHVILGRGRDYADVPPTHGVFRGKTESELYVAVQVEASLEAPALDRKLPIPDDWSVLVERAQQPGERVIPTLEIQQMQQQQQAKPATQERANPPAQQKSSPPPASSAKPK